MNFQHVDEVLNRVNGQLPIVSNTHTLFDLASNGEHGYRIIYYTDRVLVPGLKKGIWFSLSHEETAEVVARLGGINWRLTFLLWVDSREVIE